MSSSFFTQPPPPPPPSDDFVLNLGFGYSIAIALAFLILLSAFILASYICCRNSQTNTPTSSSSSELTNINSRRRRQHPTNNNNNGIIVPRVVFFTDDDDDDNISNNVGLDAAVINSYPKFTYNKHQSVNYTIDSNSRCSICLCEYKDSEMIRMLPDCRHCFHLTCVVPWLKLNASCPVCRNSPLPTPMSTPLSEVVPLSQYPADGGRRIR